MTKYQEIISHLKNIDPAKAEYLEEEIDIIIHKLKFLTEDNFPKAILLDQGNDFHPIESSILAEKIKISGGRYITNLEENPDCILILQRSENLYSQIPSLFTNTTVTSSGAFANNNIYILQDANFNQADENYLKDTEILAEIFQPKYFVYGHDGEFWVKFDVQ